MISHHLNIHIKTKISKITNATKWIQKGSLKSNEFLTSFVRRKFGITELDVKLETFLVLIHSSDCSLAWNMSLLHFLLMLEVCNEEK